MTQLGFLGRSNISLNSLFTLKAILKGEFQENILTHSNKSAIESQLGNYFGLYND